MKTLTRTLLFTIALIFAGTALAKEHGQDRRGSHGAPGLALPVVEHLTKALRRLELTAEQKKAAHAELKAMREQIRPLMLKMRENRKSLHELISAETYDSDAVAEAAAAQGSLTAEITRIAGGTAAAVLAKLTAEQRTRLAAMGERAREKRAERLERHREPETGTGAQPPDES